MAHINVVFTLFNTLGRIDRKPIKNNGLNRKMVYGTLIAPVIGNPDRGKKS
jgi:hypothetical protein